VERFEQIGAAAIPGAAQELQAEAQGKVAQAPPDVFGELELESVLAVGSAERVAVDVRLLDRRASQKFVERALLELDGVGAAVGRDAHQVLGEFRIAVVVDAAFGQHETRLPLPDGALPNANCRYHAVHPPSTTRLAPVM